MHIDEGLHGQLDVKVITLYVSNKFRLASADGFCKFSKNVVTINYDNWNNRKVCTDWMRKKRGAYVVSCSLTLTWSSTCCRCSFSTFSLSRAASTEARVCCCFRTLCTLTFNKQKQRSIGNVKKNKNILSSLWVCFIHILRTQFGMGTVKKHLYMISMTG